MDLECEVLISMMREVFVRVVDVVTADEGDEPGDIVQFIVVPSPRVVLRAIEETLVMVNCTFGGSIHQASP